MFLVFSEVILKRPNLEVSCLQVKDNSHTLTGNHGYNTSQQVLTGTNLLCPLKENKLKKKKKRASLGAESI